MTQIINKPSMLTPEKISVESSGENVLINIGNSTLTLNYIDALTISQWIRVRAKESKRRAGDTARHWSTLGILEGAK